MARAYKRTVLITGAAGFMGSCFTNMHMRTNPSDRVVVIDALTSVSDKKNLKVWKHPLFVFKKCDIRDARAVNRIFAAYKPAIVIHFAAETHVDASIRNPRIFLETNILGTHTIAQACMTHGVKRMLHISTDEVYGALSKNGRPFTEHDAMRPNSPYSASKAGAEHVVRAFHETFGLPVVVARCSNNYGPGQDVTKFIPVCITKLLDGKKVPVYGSGKNVRDWIYVEDAAAAFEIILRKGTDGEVYNVGASHEERNIDVVTRLLELTGRDRSQIEFVTDRPGHDFRYALSTTKIRRLGWKPAVSFAEGLQRTVAHFRNR